MPPPNRPLPPIPLNPYTTMLRDKPLDVFRRYAVSPPDAAVGDEVIDALGATRRNRVMQVSSKTGINREGMFGGLFRPGADWSGPGFEHGVVGSAAKKIAWIKLVDDPVRHGALTFQAVIPSSKEKIPRSSIPVWFLPWESRNLVELTIPPRASEEDNDPEDPGLFFTAGINGCSVFVSGDARSPTITHAGISQGQTPYGNDPSAFWRHLLMAHRAYNGQDSGRVAEVNNTDYINQTGVSGGAFTSNTDQYEKWLKTLPTNPMMKVSHVVPWGCVFGIRYGRLWSFYLQENAVVHTYTLKAEYKTVSVTSTKTRLKVFKTEKTEEVSIRRMVQNVTTVNRPVRVSDFFPGRGSSKVNFIEKWQRW